MRHLTPERAEIEHHLYEGKHVQSRQQIYDEAIEMFERALNRKLDRMRSGESLSLSFQIHVIDRDGKVKLSESRPTHTKAYRVWHKAVLERDSYICQECGSDQDLVVHHIKQWAQYPELRFEVSNGVTLCSECHSRKHPNLSYGRTKK